MAGHSLYAEYCAPEQFISGDGKLNFGSHERIGNPDLREKPFWITSLIQQIGLKFSKNQTENDMPTFFEEGHLVEWVADRVSEVIKGNSSICDSFGITRTEIYLLSNHQGRLTIKIDAYPNKKSETIDLGVITISCSQNSLR